MNAQDHTLIPAREALKIITWVNYYGLYHGSRGTDVLTRFPHGLYSREECQALKAKIINQGVNCRPARSQAGKKISYELV